MTSSDATALPPGAVEAAAGRVGTSLGPRTDAGARVALACATFNGGITARLPLTWCTGAHVLRAGQTCASAS